MYPWCGQPAAWGLLGWQRSVLESGVRFGVTRLECACQSRGASRKSFMILEGGAKVWGGNAKDGA